MKPAIRRQREDCSLVVIGATERGLLSRLVPSLTLDVVDDVGASVLLAQRPSSRGLIDRLFDSPVTPRRTEPPGATRPRRDRAGPGAGNGSAEG